MEGTAMRSLRRALIDGVLVMLPLGAIVLLVLGMVRRLQDAADPLSGHFVHPLITAVVLLLLLCLVIGFLIRSAAGRRTRHTLERHLFEKIPGYRLVKAFAGEGPLVEHGGRSVRPALAAIGGPVSGAGHGRVRGRAAARLRAWLAGANVGSYLHFQPRQGDTARRPAADVPEG